MSWENNGILGWLANNQSAVLNALGLGAGSGAPVGAQYLTLAIDGTLTAERRFVPSAPLSGSDGGAGSTYTLSLSGWSGTTDGQPLYRSGSGVASVTVSSPLSWSGGALGIQTASGSQAGALSAADWTAFNSKQAGSPELTGLAALGNGLPVRSGGAWASASYSTGLSLSSATLTLDAGLQSLTSADASAGLPRVTAANTWAATALGDLSVASETFRVAQITDAGAVHWPVGTLTDGRMLMTQSGSIVSGPATLSDAVKSLRAFHAFTVVLPQGPRAPNIDGAGVLSNSGLDNSDATEAGLPAFRIGDASTTSCRWYSQADYHLEAGTYTIYTVFKLGSDMAPAAVSIYAHWGLSSIVGVTVANPSGHRVTMMYRCTTGSADANWSLSTKDGTTETVTDTGVPVTAGYYYVAKLVVTSSSASLWIGRGSSLSAAHTAFNALSAASATSSSTLPSATVGLYLIDGMHRSTGGVNRSKTSGGTWMAVETPAS